MDEVQNGALLPSPSGEDELTGWQARLFLFQVLSLF
jgi:hypothetical protein